MNLSVFQKYLVIVNAISLMVAFMTHFPEIVALLDSHKDPLLFPGMDWIDVCNEMLFTYISLLLLYFLNEKLFHFNNSHVEISWKKLLCAFVVTWIASSLIAKGFIFLHQRLDIPAIDATLHHYLHPLRDFLISIMVTGSSYLMYQNHKSNCIQLENRQLRAENIENQYEALKNQFNPHMLFNSLNTLSALIRESPDKAQNYLQELSHVLRYTLQDNDSHLVSLEEEMTFVNSYIYLMKMRYEDNLVFDLDISPKALQKELPPMTVQMLVENAIKHNEISNRKPLHISITAVNDTLSVSNPIQSKITSNNRSTRIGLDNLAKRYRLLFMKNIEISNENNVFTVTIPLI